MSLFFFVSRVSAELIFRARWSMLSAAMVGVMVMNPSWRRLVVAVI